MTGFKRPIVFLHIPKTAGQTIHNALQSAVGAANVSPVRTHTQAKTCAAQMPAGYALYSGHIDWVALQSLPNPFTFSVLRDPRERIASFYFYLRKEARGLSVDVLHHPENLGKKTALTETASAYFFGGDDRWQHFIRDHYDNFYCSYFATRKMRGWSEVSKLPQEDKVARALDNLEQVNRVYSTKHLDQLEHDLSALLKADINVVGTYVNKGSMPQSEPRWPRLLARLDSDKDIARLNRFVDSDRALIDALNLQV